MNTTPFFCHHCGAANERVAEMCVACGASLLAEQGHDADRVLLGRYRVVRQVGTGGFGAVYQAEDTLAGLRLVAVKEIRLRGLTAQEMIEATDTFNREVQLLTGLRHPNLPRMYASATDTEHWYLIMEFIAGETLEAYLQQSLARQQARAASVGRILPLREKLDIGIQLCTVLDYLHSRPSPIIFRDLKPANIMRTSSGHLYLIDFGIARHFKPGQARDTIALGSPGYAAPEQYGKAQTTPASDIYSLGATLHYLLSGIDPSETPFHFAPLPSAPPELEELILQMVEIDARKRPQHAANVKERLQAIAALTQFGEAYMPAQPAQSAPAPIPASQLSGVVGRSGLTQPYTPSQPVSRRNIVLGLVGLAAGLAVAGGSVVGLLQAHQSEQGVVGAGQPLPRLTIKIASLLSVSGQDASLGKPVENSIHMAIDEANARGDFPFPVIFRPTDDVGPSGLHDPAVGAQNMTALADDALVAGVIGPLHSDVARAIMPIANQVPLALVSPNTTFPCLTVDLAESGCSGGNNLLPTMRPTGKTTFFRLSPYSSLEGVAAARFLYKTLKYRSVYVARDAETYSLGLSNSFMLEWQSLGGNIAGQATISPTQTSFLSLLSLIATLSPDAIFFSGVNSDNATVMRQQMMQISALRHTAFMGGDAMMTSTFATTIGGFGGPIYATLPGVNADNLPAAQSFIAKYKAKYGAESYNQYCDVGYDSANLLLQAIKTAMDNGAAPPMLSNDMGPVKTFHQAVINAIQQTRYTGITGPIAFDPNGDNANHTISIYQLGATSDGSWGWNFREQQLTPVV